MLKINLLHSVTERQGGAVMSVDRRVSSPGMRLLMITLATGFLLFAVIGWDVISTQMAKVEAERQLEEQKQIAAELESVMKEQKELETKIAAIDARINAIKKLREEQKGPSAVLDALRDRIAMVPGLYLQSVEQKGEQVEIKGNSPDEAAVTQFGRSLEFSNGLFANLNIETQRQEVAPQNAAPPKDGTEPQKINVVNFTIRAGYSAKGGAATATAANGQPAAAAPGQPAPVQVAKN
ncbi:MAG: PilN domain-containing protein [Pyrinomonadaceae bacterium]